MKKTETQNFARLSGTAAPLGALKTARSCGIGEYPDLEAFADFCAAAGLKLIQLLPVNDTGTESSPYSALSACALNPVYISIESLPEYNEKTVAAERLKNFRAQAEGEARFSYPLVRKEKLEILRLIYGKNAVAIAKDADFCKWVDSNASWLGCYAVFMEKKRVHLDASWKEWPQEERALSRAAILGLWNDAALKEQHLFYAWVQFRCHQQFKKAADYAAKKGIILKGDIPILMNEDSCDVWANPELFDQTMRAGAPPDMYNVAGQNWGFPVYNWETLKETGYAWWKERLVSASAYYKAYRLDHILGFFRIFKISERDTTAYLGRPDPLVPITAKELAGLGFSPDRIRWLSEPHVPSQPCIDANNGDYLGTHGVLNQVMNRINAEELWLFKPEITGERDILSLNIPEGIKDVLFHYWHNRSLIKTGSAKGGDEFYPAWSHENTTAWQSLSEEEKSSLKLLFEKKNKSMEKLWETHGGEILGALTGFTGMKAFAEDLGVNFKAVPKTLKELGVYSLKVVRWERYYDREGEPYIPVKKYPPLSVTTTSVHDSSTARLWWEKERGGAEFAAQNKAPKDVAENAASGVYSAKDAAWFLGEAASSGSGVFICPIQDYLALTDAWRSEDAEAERINVPGTVNGFNWTWRLPATIETLAKDKDLVEAISLAAKKHGN